MLIAVVIPTYNRVDALEAVLEGYLHQTDRNFEIIIADDGSQDETRQAIERFSKKVKFPVKHVWQEDLGFRLSAIRNKAVAATQAEYLIFTDGDCIPLPTFIANHRQLAEKGWFLSGNRVLLSEQFTQQILSNRTPVHHWNMLNWLKSRVRKEVNRISPFIKLWIPNFIRKGKARDWRGAKTCNLSLWRSDFILINGMDESYVAWGMDDSDLVVRLFNAGIRRKSARFSAPVLHLWHRENDRGGLKENILRFEALLTSKRIKATTGFNQHANSE